VVVLDTTRSRHSWTVPLEDPSLAGRLLLLAAARDRGGQADLWVRLHGEGHDSRGVSLPPLGAFDCGEVGIGWALVRLPAALTGNASLEVGLSFAPPLEEEESRMHVLQPALLPPGPDSDSR
jgi:hypothetical protein